MDAKAEVPRTPQGGIAPLAATGAAHNPRLYFINGPIDFALVGGLSIAIYFLIHVIYGSHDPRLDPGVRTATDPVVRMSQAFLWICNWPHFASTSYRLYHSRDNIKQYPLTALVIPWLVLAGVFGSILYPATIAPVFILTFMLWSPYHFSGQTMGVTLIYARRAGFAIGKLERLALSTFVFGTFLSTTMDAHVKGNPFPPYFGIPVNSLGLPVWMAIVSEVLMYFAGVAFLFLTIRWCIINRRVVPAIVLLPAVAQYFWFVNARAWPTFTEFVPFFHSMQYLMIAWSMQLKEKLDLSTQNPRPRRSTVGWVVWGAATLACAVMMYYYLPWPDPAAATQDGYARYTALLFNPPGRVCVLQVAFTLYAVASVLLDRTAIKPSRHYVLFETLRWFEMNIFFGALLFSVFPTVLNKFGGVDPYVALGVTAAAVQIHHFFVDGVIWKLKRKTVSSPLMVNIDEMLSPAPVSAPGGPAVPALAGAGTMALPATPQRQQV